METQTISLCLAAVMAGGSFTAIAASILGCMWRWRLDAPRVRVNRLDPFDDCGIVVANTGKHPVAVMEVGCMIDWTELRNPNIKGFTVAPGGQERLPLFLIDGYDVYVRLADGGRFVFRLAQGRIDGSRVRFCKVRKILFALCNVLRHGVD